MHKNFVVEKICLLLRKHVNYQRKNVNAIIEKVFLQKEQKQQH